MSRSYAVIALVLLSCGCAAFRAEMDRTALVQAGEDLGTRCGALKVTSLNDWSFRAENSCGEVAYYRCGTHDQHGSRQPYGRHVGLLHFDCHRHGSEQDVVGLFHPHDAFTRTRER